MASSSNADTTKSDSTDRNILLLDFMGENNADPVPKEGLDGKTDGIGMRVRFDLLSTLVMQQIIFVSA